MLENLDNTTEYIELRIDEMSIINGMKLKSHYLTKTMFLTFSRSFILLATTSQTTLLTSKNLLR